MFSQMVQTIGVSELIDIWNKRGYRTKAADEGIQYHRLLLEDVLREVTHAVRSAFADVLRERAQLDFTHEVAARYSDTVRLSRSRFEAGEISESELRKIELEGLKYQNGLVDAQLEYDLARQQLAALLALSSEAGLPATLTKPPVAPQTRTVAELTQQALRSRPDYLAVAQSRRLAQATVSAAHREVYPDLTLGVAYTHSSFLASGDNPNAWGLAASMPVPVFDRNQANIGRANVNLQSTENDGIRLELSIRHAVAEATRKLQRAEALLGIYTTGGMLDRAETSLRVAERSYKTGATSLLGLLEAQRTYLETRDDYLRAVNDEQQSAIDLEYAVGKKLQ
jgi:cobalt-zinc-cadmium efflux system outer membrane protein